MKNKILLRVLCHSNVAIDHFLVETIAAQLQACLQFCIFFNLLLHLFQPLLERGRLLDNASALLPGHLSFALLWSFVTHENLVSAILSITSERVQLDTPN